MKLFRHAVIAVVLVVPLLNVHGGVQAHSPSASSAVTYTVRAGEGFAAIARKLGVRLRDLLAANHLAVTSTIHPGQVLVVPNANLPAPLAPPADASSRPAGGTGSYTVKAGDSLFAIARRNGVTLDALLAANSFTTTTTILPGQVIRVPGTPAPATPPAPTVPPQATSGALITTLVEYLRAQVGKPYKFFTAGPDAFDCSGLVVAGYRQIGIALPHQSRMQSSIGTAVDLTTQPIMAGDLIFMVSSVDPTRIGHVGVALGDGTWIQAVAEGVPVRIRPLPSVDKISAVRRIVGP